MDKPRRTKKELAIAAITAWLEQEEGYKVMATTLSVDGIKKTEGPNPYAHTLSIKFDGAKG